MTDGDDELRRRYRELAREEPPPSIDAAIKAAAYRAVASPRASQRWAVPVSIAAVLFLAVGVTLRMQDEQPGVETSMPTSEYPVSPSGAPEAQEDTRTVPATQPGAPAPQAKFDASPAAPPPLTRPQAMRDSAPPPARAEVVETEKRTRSEGFALQKRATDAIAPEAGAPAQTPDAAAPSPRAFPQAPMTTQSPPLSERSESTRLAEPPVSAAIAPAAPAAAVSAQSTPQRAKRESLGAAADASREAADPRERELERIARLRNEGRHAEADEALARFRRANPDYKIPVAYWERVKPR